jgi:hypothetical protein
MKLETGKTQKWNPRFWVWLPWKWVIDWVNSEELKGLLAVLHDESLLMALLKHEKSIGPSQVKLIYCYRLQAPVKIKTWSTRARTSFVYKWLPLVTPFSFSFFMNPTNIIFFKTVFFIKIHYDMFFHFFILTY